MAWARRIHKSDERVRALPFQRLIAVLAEVTGSKATHLRQEPALRGADPHLAQLVATLRELVPQQGLGPAPWARRIYKSSARDQLRAMPYKRRIAVLAEVTEGTESNLSQVLELRDTDPEMAQLANTIRTRVPQEDLEAPAACARRIRDDEEVSAMQYDRRIAVLAAVTGVREGSLRLYPALRDIDPRIAELVHTLRGRVPQEDRESPTVWARRINKRGEPELRAMRYDRRIAVLAAVTGATESNLRREPALRDTNPEMAQLVDTLRGRVLQADRESPQAWARRIYKLDEEVRAMPYNERIAVLAAVTGALEGNLRQVQELRDTDPQMAQLADNIRTRVPREDDVRAQQPAPLGLLQAEWRDIEAAIVLMRQRGMVRETAEGAVGLPSGALAAVVDAYGRWLDEHAQAQALVGLTDEQLTSFCQMLEHLHQEL
ncbi:MAG: hypothetical protein JF606_22720 [Burkholderiales bacterium]|nr:hypothetical protein [Burkholderiales bacterium]